MEVIVLAGGLGTRLRSVVHEIPKCLAPIGASGWSVFPGANKRADASGNSDAPCGEGKPFLAYLLDWLWMYPVEHVVFSVGYLKEQVIAFVEGRQWPFSYDFACEDMPLGTGGGIRMALSLCQEDKVFVVNGDTFYPVDLNAMPFDKPVTLALKPMKDFDRYGAVAVQASAGPVDVERTSACGGMAMAEEKWFFAKRCEKYFPSAARQADVLTVTAFHEKAPCKEGLINGGVYALDRSRLDLCGLPERFSFEKEVLEPGAAIGEIGGWVSDAYFIDIGVPEDYELAQWAIPAWKAVQKASKAVLTASADTLFLDRDGVLNRHLPGDYVKNWAQWQWMPGVLQELPGWAAKFRRIILVSNQRGVGKGLMTDEDLSRIHAQMMTEILEAGGRIDLLLTCTAVLEDDPRRKPNIGMFLEAQALFPEIDAKSSVMLGDTPSDAAFAQNCGMQFILLNPEAVS